jgi:hypothetical protein
MWIPDVDPHEPGGRSARQYQPPDAGKGAGHYVSFSLFGDYVKEKPPVKNIPSAGYNGYERDRRSGGFSPRPRPPEVSPEFPVNKKAILTSLERPVSLRTLAQLKVRHIDLVM